MQSIIQTTCKCFQLKLLQYCIHIQSIIQECDSSSVSLTHWCWLSRDPVSQPAEVLPISPDADTLMPQSPALPLFPSGGYAVSDWCGCTLADTPSALDCTAGVEIAAICSNSASNFDMYEDQSNSQPSPQGPCTLFDASHHQPTGIFVHFSTSAGTKF